MANKMNMLWIVYGCSHLISFHLITFIASWPSSFSLLILWTLQIQEIDCDTFQKYYEPQDSCYGQIYLRWQFQKCQMYRSDIILSVRASADRTFGIERRD
jgi:hypothetical protein